jgi:hypothetical protein
MPTQRLLTATEQAGFFARHPLEFEYVAKTKIALAAGVYDWTQTLPDWFFGMIPPWGTQVADSTYGNVTIFFGADGTLYVSGFTDTLGDINKPAYVPPIVKCSDGSDPVFGICMPDLKFGENLVFLAGAAAAVYIGYQVLFATPRR